MAHSKSANRVKRNHSRQRGRNELNVVPMIDIMLIMVFFLIFSAVFTRTSILELNLPAANAAFPDAPETMQLEVVVRKAGIEVQDRLSGLSFGKIEKDEKGYNFVALSELLQLLKSKYPDKTDAAILLESDIEYDTLVQTMDCVRLFKTPGKNFNYGELFPDVSVGDAPT
jgi:biopolymer transport protein ExbD